MATGISIGTLSKVEKKPVTLSERQALQATLKQTLTEFKQSTVENTQGGSGAQQKND